MALTLTVEDGSGVAGANSYISAADADLYFEGHVYASLWLEKATSEKEQALVHAARVLDQNYLWFGYKTHETQEMQWPRMEVLDPDRQASSYTPWMAEPAYLDSQTIYPWLKNAQCELALAILTGNRAADLQGAGLRSFSLDGVFTAEFDNAGGSQKPLIPDWVATECGKYGRLVSATSKVVPLRRG